MKTEETTSIEIPKNLYDQFSKIVDDKLQSTAEEQIVDLIRKDISEWNIDNKTWWYVIYNCCLSMPTHITTILSGISFPLYSRDFVFSEVKKIINKFDSDSVNPIVLSWKQISEKQHLDFVSCSKENVNL